MPRTSSITKYGRPVSVVPASSTLAMFGWSIIARACRSASKRAMTCLLSMPGLMIFSATRRRTGSLLLGHIDHAHAPFADLLQQLVGADAACREVGLAEDGWIGSGGSRKLAQGWAASSR